MPQQPVVAQTAMSAGSMRRGNHGCMQKKCGEKTVEKKTVEKNAPADYRKILRKLDKNPINNIAFIPVFMGRGSTDMSM
ncbi:MAG: hypothetical protein HC800_25720 [Phormidesmis sp. RL_2_1]|nr:hypothetical protein [Phormidesmis sp. RL_2_1]